MDEVAPGVLVATSAVYATTSTVLVGEGGACLLVDPGVTTRELGGLVAELAARGLRPVGRWVTHGHWDHVLTHGSWADVPAWWDAPTGSTPTADDAAWHDTIAAERDADAELVRVAPGDRPDVLPRPPAPLPGPPASRPGTEPASPTTSRSLDWPGPRTVVVPSPGHAPGHSSLWLQHAHVLIAGDLLSDTEVPLLDLGSPDPLRTYAATLDALDVLRADVLVPGHGTLARGDAVAARFAADRAYLAALAARRDAGDPRLSTPWVAAEHARQRAALRC